MQIVVAKVALHLPTCWRISLLYFVFYIMIHGMVKRIIATIAPLEVPRGRKGGFTLVELLTVLAIAAILAILTLPAVEGLQKAGGFNKSVYALADSLNLARSYAMGNNTYVYVGLTEVDRSQNTLASPQLPGSGVVGGTGGRVVLAIVATTDGTSDSTSWSTTGANLTQVRQPQLYDFFHIANTSAASQTSFLTSATSTGNMAAKPSGITAATWITLVTTVPLPVATPPGATAAFSLPLGSTSGTGKYNFSNTNTQIICFNPQGEVLLNGATCQRLEIDVQATTGNTTPALPASMASVANGKNQFAALLIDGVTGSITVYRP
jgi:prepilin-type N-terminal cleavage/methylation domain-containing protein